MKNLTNVTLCAFALLLAAACQPKKSSETNSEASDEAEKKEMTTSLEKTWETDTLLKTPESVLYDKSNNVLYVSCIAGVPPDAQDEDGYIAKVSPEDGSIVELQWITGLDAPKGMGLYDGTLYVADIDKLVAIDVASGEIANRYPVEGAEFLNDITVDNDGNVYFSDSNTGKIHKFSDGAVTLWAEAEGRPNGLFYDGDIMFLATFSTGKFNEIDFNTQEVKPVVDSIPGGDGIVKVGMDFLVSNWNGEIYHINSAYEKTKILDTKEMGANAADIEFISASNTLLVPTFFGNQVVAYKLNK